MRVTNQDERDSKAKKILGVAIGATAAAVAFNKSGVRKYANEAARAFKAATKSIEDDVAKYAFRELDYKNISGIVKRNLTGENSVYKQALNNKISLSNNNGFVKDLKSIIDIRANKSTMSRKIQDARVKEKLLSDILDKVDLNKAEKRKMHQLIDGIVNNKGRYINKVKDKEEYVLNKRFKDTIKGTALEKHSENIQKAFNKSFTDIEFGDFKNKIDKEYKETISKNIENALENEIIMKHTNKANNKNFFDDVIERAATVKDVVDSYNKDPNMFDDDTKDIINEIINFKNKNKHKDIDSIVVSKDLRVLKGELYSSRDLNDTVTGFKESFADTIPGKLFGVRSFLDKGKAPGFFYMPKGSYDANIGKIMGNAEGILEKDFFFMGGSVYSLNGTGLVKEKALDDMELVSGVHGLFNVLNDKLHGNFQYRKNDNKLLDLLSINTTGTNVFEKAKTIITKKDDNDWIRNSYKIVSNEIEADAYEYMDAAININKLLGDSLRTPTKKEINQVKEVLSSTQAIKIISALEDDNPMSYLIDRNIKEVSGNLKTMMNATIKNKDYKDTIVKIGNSGGIKGLNVLDGDDIIRREILKSALKAEAAQSSGVSGYAKVLDRIENSSLNDGSKKYVNRMLFWTNIESLGKMTTDVSKNYNDTLDDLVNRSKEIASLFISESSNGQNQKYLESIKAEISSLVKESSSIIESIDVQHKDAINGYKSNNWVAIKKARGINVNDILEDINNSTITNGKTASFLKQFVASRDNPEDITTATLLPFHMLNRLTSAMDKFGLGFDPRQTSSVGSLASNIMLKRVLPIAAGLTALSYLDYESENLTGTSLKQAYENAKANSVLGIKQFQSNIGISDSMKTNRMYNPVASYLFGEYKDEEEYLDYLEYGSDPVRKGRYWSFGSTSEFRGGKISYFEPNSLRQAHSNYKDIAIYGSTEEKWKHSLIPTIRHPFSTLRYLMNPYWVEDLNYDDRPYPVSGKMFADGTPWGAILNPTIGQIIKPQIRMHKEDMTGLKDPRSITRQINEAIKERSAESSVIRLDDSGMTPIALSPKGMPSLNEQVFNIRVDGNNIDLNGVRGADYAESLQSLNYAILPGGDGSGYENATEYGGHFSSGGVQGGIDPRDIVSSLNADIIYAGTHDDVVTTERARLYTTPYRESAEIEKNKFINSLKVQNAGNAYLNDAFESAKELSGMYGFLFEQLMPSKKGYKLAEAGSITSFSRGFWDENIGGFGGDFMEIARRFFPHQNHNITEVNPLRNTQPLWLPENFLTGDPYTKVPKGEARLPGRGYEALNELHSDHYGRYGSFDRFKILADVAPSSEEYKIWKKIAKEEITDPKLKKQMKVIEKQAKQQTKEHDFYDYRFLTKSMHEERAVIDKVNNDGTFTIVNDGQTYAIAGLKMNGQDSQIHNYLSGGMEVTLKYEDNDYRKFRNQSSFDKGKPPVIAAIVDNGENIGAKMWHDGAAEEIDDDYKTTLADNLFAASSQDIVMGHMWEAIGHMRLPYLHNKFLRINSPMETYKHEQIYGSSYATWDHPIEGFVKPAFREAFSKGPIPQAIGLGTWALSEYARTTDWNENIKTAAHGLFALTNPAAFSGGMIGGLPRMSVGSNNGMWNAKNGARIGAVVGLTGYAIAHLENPILSAANFAAIGGAIFNQLAPEVGDEVLGGKFGAIAGAVTGIALSQLKNPDFKLSNWKETYIPEKTKEKWEIEEYFDRLTYEKYKTLYEKAARKAASEEGVDVQRIYNKIEYARNKNEKEAQRSNNLLSMASKYITNFELNEDIQNSVNAKMEALSIPEQYFEGGEYTKSAIAYKKAMDTTIYGLSKYSSQADILRALPKYDRDFFLEFSKEKDPEAKKEILRYISPYKAKALKAMWGEDVENEESNREFFTEHNMPGLFWGGWNPSVDLEDVKMKVIENEGMLLSDFGIYESRKDEPAYQNAPSINNYNSSTDTLGIKNAIHGMLGGIGLLGVDVSVEPSSNTGIDIIANVVTAGTQNLNNAVNSFLSSTIL